MSHRHSFQKPDASTNCTSFLLIMSMAFIIVDVDANTPFRFRHANVIGRGLVPTEAHDVILSEQNIVIVREGRLSRPQEHEFVLCARR